MQRKTFVSKVFQMSSVMLVLNISNVVYSIYMSKKAGAEGIGMFHLVMSIFSVARVFSVSGINLTVTRLISDMPRSLAKKCADSVVSGCIRVCMVPSCIAGAVLFFGGDILADKILGNPGCGICLKILSLTLCFSAVSSVMNGYFTAFGRVNSIAFCSFVSELSLWGGTVLFMRIFTSVKTYMAVVIGFAIGSVVEAVCGIVLRYKSRNALYCKNGSPYRDILKLCVPIAAGSYLRTGLTSVENILIPGMLAAYGVVNPVASYGVIKGMILPIIMFPMVFTGAFTSLIVPEIAARRSHNMTNGIRYISSLSVEYILKFAIFVSGIFIMWHREIGRLLFDEAEVSLYLKLLCVFPVFMFFDSVVDSVLKGMDEQVASLKINIFDSFFRVVCVVFLVPHFGMAAYVGIMYLSEIVNLGFSYIRLKKVTGVVFPLKNGLLTPIVSVAATMLIIRIMPLCGLWSGMAVFAAMYIVFIYFLKRE